MKKQRLTGVLALGAAASLLLAGCAGTGSTEGDVTPDSESKGTITLGYIPSWTDGLSTAYLLENQLGELGYEVKMEELTEAGVLYAGLSNGDIDIYPSAWPEVTHADYMNEFGDGIEDLASYYSGASLTIAVPSYTDIDSLEDLAGNADMFGGEIIGIEPGAGLTGVTQDSMMPAYGLDGEYNLVTSSTATMLTSLGQAIDNNEDIVVTLWRPFWAYNAYDVKDLADPLGAMGETESLHFLGKLGFADEFPEAAEYIAGITLDDAAYGELEGLVTSEEWEGDPAGAVSLWISENPGAYPTLISG
jgi:glycine betaine/proline transport system substrate-binding protein